MHSGRKIYGELSVFEVVSSSLGILPLWQRRTFIAQLLKNRGLWDVRNAPMGHLTSAQLHDLRGMLADLSDKGIA